MALLGDDGRGYELARKLEVHGVWRPWLGDALYSSFLPFLSSSSTWDAFMRADDSKSKPQIHLQLRVRALLFDKALVSLFIQPSRPAPISNLNPNYLKLHGDDVYFTLDNGTTQDGDQRQPASAASNISLSKGYSKTSMNVGSRFSESEVDAVSQRFKLEDFPETWYSQFFENNWANKPYRLMFGDRDSEKRTPEQMSNYLRVLENHKRRRAAFKDNASNLRSNSVLGESTAVDDIQLFPETMFTLNCVPDSAVLQTSGLENIQKVQFNGVLDNLPQIMTKSPVISPIMIERLGIRPEYLNMEQGLESRSRNGYPRNRKLLSQEQASQMTQKLVARLLANIGFESSLDSTLEVLAQFLSCHISKLGRILKLLADSYRQQCSATELIKMFLQTAGYSNMAAMSELMKDSSKNAIQQTQQQVLGMQVQLQSQQQPSMQQSHQILRQMSPQMQQMNNPQYLAFQQQQQQQQLERMRRRQQTAPRPGMNVNMNMNNMNMNMNVNMNVDKDRPLVQVKMENSSEFPVDANAFTAINSRQPQFTQLRQQQLAAYSSLHTNNSFRPMTSVQIPQIHSPNMGMARAPPVKVEGFQELMGGDSSMKHDQEDNKLISPQK